MAGASTGIRDAASVIALRAPARGRGAEPEVLLVQRRSKASFMAGAWVFPGGAVDAHEGDPRLAAVRELFEEVGILLARPVDERDGASAPALAQLRRRVLDGEPFEDVLAARGLRPDLDSLHYFSQWITPSIEKKRFAATFYVASAPASQAPDTAGGELAGARWLAPSEALDAAAELKLPPPQIRTLRDLRVLSGRGGMDEILASCAERAKHPFPILPRAAPAGDGFALLLPWDPEYDGLGQGESRPMPANHPLAEGPSRFILEDATWKLVDAPRLPSEA